MHFIIGSLMVVGTFLLSMQYMTREFDGFWNAYSLILLSGVPLGLVIATYRFSTLGTAVRTLLSAATHQPERARTQMLERLVAFGREVRRDRGASASALLEKTGDPLFEQLGRHVLQSSPTEEIEADALLLGRRQIEPYQSAERVMSTLGNTAPAMGMVGTVIGLIQLLVHMSNFDELGSGMAIALLTTFYGLVLGHVVYLPIARFIADHGTQRAETCNLVIDGMLKLSRRRPLHEVQQVIGGGDNITSAVGDATGATA